MTSNRRQQRRPGVVYGPPRGREPSGSGFVIGRLLGLALLVLTLGLLAVGVLAFMGNRGGPARSPARSSFAGASPTNGPTPLPTEIVALPSLASTPSPVGPSESPTTAPPNVEIGLGFVTFGTRTDGQAHIVDPRATFARNERITWSAFLTAPANSVDLRLQIYKQDPAAVGGEVQILDSAVQPVVVHAQLLEHRIRPDVALQGQGIYVVRYVRGTELMSEGYFQVTN